MRARSARRATVEYAPATATLVGTAALPVKIGCMTGDRDGLALGLRIIAARDQDGLVLRLAEAYEAAAGWRPLPPPPLAPSGR
jgi:Asp-tRNA(Asn)/Glu-tRNA(Gln) amidotransferase A subunit family amidase